MHNNIEQGDRIAFKGKVNSYVVQAIDRRYAVCIQNIYLPLQKGKDVQYTICDFATMSMGTIPEHPIEYPLYSQEDCQRLLYRIESGETEIDESRRQFFTIETLWHPKRTPEKFSQDLPLTEENVEKLFNDCLISEKEDHSRFTGLIESVIDNTYFRIETEYVRNNFKLIDSWIDQLPEQFFYDKGGGWSFLNLFMTRDGAIWTTSPKVMEQFLILTMAAKRVKYLVPRFCWYMFPEGMPYIVIKDRPLEKQRKDVKERLQREEEERKRIQKEEDDKILEQIRKRRRLEREAAKRKKEEKARLEKERLQRERREEIERKKREKAEEAERLEREKKEEEERLWWEEHADEIIGENENEFIKNMLKKSKDPGYCKTSYNKKEPELKLLRLIKDNSSLTNYESQD